MRFEHIVWDFNGTILDDVDTGIVSVNKLLRDRELPEIKSVEEYHGVFCFPIKKYYSDLGFDFEKEPYEVIAPLWVEQYMINVKNAKIFDDILPCMELFRSAGVRQSVISATEIEMLKGQLAELGIIDYFDEICGLDNIHAESKLSLVKKWGERHAGERVLVIGDTDHDLEMAELLGAECALICRGHQSESYLKTLNTKVYSDLSHLIDDTCCDKSEK